MSKFTRQSRGFISLLLSTTKAQSKALIYTITPEQATALCEIFLNIDSLSLNSKQLEAVRKYSSLIKKLTNPNLSLPKRQTNIQNYHLQVINCLSVIKSQVKKHLL